jgi:hypothetical protein
MDPARLSTPDCLAPQVYKGKPTYLRKSAQETRAWLEKEAVTAFKSAGMEVPGYATPDLTGIQGNGVAVLLKWEEIMAHRMAVLTAAGQACEGPRFQMDEERRRSQRAMLEEKIALFRCQWISQQVGRDGGIIYTRVILPTTVVHASQMPDLLYNRAEAILEAEMRGGTWTDDRAWSQVKEALVASAVDVEPTMRTALCDMVMPGHCQSLDTAGDWAERRAQLMWDWAYDKYVESGDVAQVEALFPDLDFDVWGCARSIHYGGEGGSGLIGVLPPGFAHPDWVLHPGSGPMFFTVTTDGSQEPFAPGPEWTYPSAVIRAEAKREKQREEKAGKRRRRGVDRGG